jgi:heat shock protein HtpX
MYEQITRNKRRSVIVAVLFVLVWVGIGAGVGALGGSGSNGVVTGVVVASILALLGVLYSLSAGRNLVLRASGAVPADPTTYAQLHNVVEELALAAGIPKPDVYVIQDPSPNAFATGISPKKAAITTTTGLLETMNREELEGVISHEMSHIKNYDVRLILIVSTLIGMAALLASIVWRIGLFSRPRGKDSGQIMLVIFATGAALTLVAVIVGPLIKLALSRSRESLADASGVEITRNPAGLIKALKKLQANDKPFVKFNHATASMCIDDPLQHHETWFHRLFDTHPPIADRIAVLEKIAGGPVSQPTTP